MSILQKILGRQNNGPVPVDTPEWPELDGQLAIRRLSPMERVEFDSESSEQKANEGVNFVTFTALFCAVTADGKRAFATEEWKALIDDPGSGSAIDRLFTKADEVNFLSKAAKERLKKKSETAPASVSTSTSPETSESR